MAKQAKRGDGPFIIEQSDGCSALSIPYRWITRRLYGEEKFLRFLDYCIEHDESYWYGGSKEQRYEADMKLFTCVRRLGDNSAEALFYTLLATGMLSVTRVMGSPKLPTPFRWMYRENFTPTMKYTTDRIEKDETVFSKKDADIVMTILENPWTSPTTVKEAVDMFNK